MRPRFLYQTLRRNLEISSGPFTHREYTTPTTGCRLDLNELYQARALSEYTTQTHAGCQSSAS